MSSSELLLTSWDYNQDCTWVSQAAATEYLSQVELSGKVVARPKLHLEILMMHAPMLEHLFAPACACYAAPRTGVCASTLHPSQRRAFKGWMQNFQDYVCHPVDHQPAAGSLQFAVFEAPRLRRRRR